jgi:hypothetical protein
MKLVTGLTAITVLALQFACCGDSFSSIYTLQLPEIPEPWASLLGEPVWRVEWLDTDGKIQSKDLPPGGTAEIAIPATWTNPVTAWPWWPDDNLFPRFFKPAGALFPFDVSEKSLRLSWKAGPDTVFYWELAFANNQNALKLPANFDWPRFRELFETEALNEAVVKDPWLVDWRNVAEKTIASNFDRRRLVPQATEPAAIPVSAGPWYGTSPFEEPLSFAEEAPPVFPTRPGVNVWISGEGILRCNGNTWVFTPR